MVGAAPVKRFDIKSTGGAQKRTELQWQRAGVCSNDVIDA